jgi:hypothetical protein
MIQLVSKAARARNIQASSMVNRAMNLKRIAVRMMTRRNATPKLVHTKARRDSRGREPTDLPFSMSVAFLGAVTVEM